MWIPLYTKKIICVNICEECIIENKIVKTV